MNKPFVPHAGAVFSADIAVPEHEREVRFYSRVLSTGDRPLWRESDLSNNLGMPIIGLGARTPEHANLPLQWMPHIQVGDVAASVERAIDLGGSALMHARDAAGRSEWAVLLDRNGAAFGVIPVVDMGSKQEADDAPSPEPASPVGRIYWLDLTVPDASATRDFYGDVVQWSAQDVQIEDGDASYVDYNMLSEVGRPAAGICHARGVNAGLPAVWLIYLPVGDLVESIRRTEEEGGTVLKARRDDDGAHAYAVIQDPAGAFFALVQA